MRQSSGEGEVFCWPLAPAWRRHSEEVNTRSCRYTEEGACLWTCLLFMVVRLFNPNIFSLLLPPLPILPSPSSWFSLVAVRSTVLDDKAVDDDDICGDLDRFPSCCCCCCCCCCCSHDDTPVASLPAAFLGGLNEPILGGL